MSQRNLSQRKQPRSSSAKKRSQSKKRNHSLASWDLNQSCISQQKKEQPSFPIVEAITKNDRICYVGDRDGKRKTFTRGEVLASNTLFQDVLNFYRLELMNMTKNDPDSRQKNQSI